MRHEEAALLETQLREAMADTPSEPAELAALAGLLARLVPDAPVLEMAREQVGAGLDLRGHAEDALDALLAVEEHDDPAESWDALTALDELCAAATFLGDPGQLTDVAEEGARTVRAFPEPWRVHAETAAALLSERAPLPRDPATRLWAAVEASRWTEAVATRDEDEGASGTARIAAGLDVVFSLGAIWGAARLAAAGTLPQDPRWRALARGAGWELALTEDEHGKPVLLLSCEGVFSRDGAPVPATRTPEGWTAPAAPGAWTVAVAGQVIEIRIAL